MRYKPPRAVKSAWLISKYGILQQIRRFASYFTRRRKKSGARYLSSSDTELKGGCGLTIVRFFGFAFFFLYLLIMGFTSSIMLYGRLHIAERDYKVKMGSLVRVDLGLARSLEDFDAKYKSLLENPDTTEAQFIDLEREVTEELEKVIAYRELDEDPSKWISYVKKNGMEKIVSGTKGVGVGVAFLEPIPLTKRVAGAVSLILILMMIAIASMNLGMTNANLGESEWKMEWLFTFPVSPKGIFFSMILEHSMSSIFSWGAVFPILTISFWGSGYRVVAVLAAILLTLAFCLATESISLLSETYLRMRFRLSTLKNFQALFTIVGMILFSLAYGLAFFAKDISCIYAFPQWLFSIASWLPTAAPFHFLRFGTLVFSCSILLSIIVSLLFPIVSVLLCERLVRFGIVDDSSILKANRKLSTRKLERKMLIDRGAIGKEILMLLRDKNVLMIMFVVPALVMGMQVWNVSRMGLSYSSCFLASYIVGFYSVAMACQALTNSEGEAIWMLFTFPKRLESIFLRKALPLVITGLFFTTVGITVSFLMFPGFTFDKFMLSALAVIGTLCYSFFATGVTIATSKHAEKNQNRRMKPKAILFLMLIGAQFAVVFKVDSFPFRLGCLVIFALLAFGIWEDVKKSAPYIFDMESKPAPDIGLTQGVLAALWFVVLQMLFALLINAVFNLNVVIVASLSYIIAGINVVPGIRIIYSNDLSFFTASHKSRNSRALVKVYSGDSYKWVKEQSIQVKNIKLTFWAALVASGFGLLYLEVLTKIPSLLELVQPSTLDINKYLFIVSILYVLAAPIIEEYIFRGFVFKAMRRRLSLPMSIFLSSVLFASIHPAASFIPVLFLGFVTAWVFEKTQHLAYPIFVHAFYNAVVIFLQIFL